MRHKIVLMLALLCAIAQGTWAQTSWEEVYQKTGTTSDKWTAINAGSTTGQTLGSAGSTTYCYAGGDLRFTNSNAGGSGLTIQGTVYLYVPQGVTLTCIGANANGQTGAGAGIELAAGNTLYLFGGGTVNAMGGNAANGGNGGNGNDAFLDSDKTILGGSGGNGGHGGGGAGAGIGTRGGTGGSGGGGGQRTGSSGDEKTQYGVDGSAGSTGGTADNMGSFYEILSSVTLVATGGSAGSNGTGGDRGLTASQHPGSDVYMASGGGGGGAGGFGGAASAIGTGGPGGGGGGGGAAGNVAWVVYSGTANGYYHAGAKGGKGGTNGDSTSAPEGTSIELTNPKYADIQGGGLRPSASDYTDDAGWEKGNAWHDGGSGGAAGSASVGGSYGTVTVDWTTQGKGTEDAPFIVSSTDDWNVFADYVNSGYAFSGEFVKLTQDISISTPVGSHVSDSDNKPFSGTFLGDGHTITVTLTDDGKQGLAPFRSIDGATIKNLKVAGTIASSQYHSAGIAGFASGTNTIEDCLVTATLNISSDYAGGIIGHGLTSATTIRGCAFTGTVNGVDGNRSNIGGIWGWSSDSATPTLVNCLEAGTYTNIASMHPMGLQSASGTITNCYYVNPQVGEPRNACTVSGAKQAYTAATTPANLGDLVKEYDKLTVYQSGVFYDGTCYMVPVSISLADNADNSTTISDKNGYVADVTLAGRTFYRDGAWNTLCLPFNATKTGPLASAIIKELDTETANGGHKTGFEDGTLYLNFKDAESIVAGRPYIVKWNAVSQEYIINPSDEVIAELDFITEVPTVDGGQATNWMSTQGPEKLVDGNTATKYGLSNANPWVEFHYTKAITPKGYAIRTAEDTEAYGSRNPKSWTIKAKNSGDADWTTLTTVDNTNMDKLPAANNQWTVFKLDNSTAYQYFRFEAEKNSEFQLAELRFCTMELGRTEFENPTFEAVNLQADAPTAVTSEDGKVSFAGYYAPVSIAEEDRSVLYLSDNSTLYYPNAAMTIGALRAHFKLNGLTASDPNAGVRAFVLNFGDGEQTGINEIVNGQSSNGQSDMWYTLDGRKLQGKPTQRGIYINNGNKIVIN